MALNALNNINLDKMALKGLKASVPLTVQKGPWNCRFNKILPVLSSL